MYDDLCFPCWFEVTHERAFSPANLPESYQEILAMAQQQYTIAAIETEYCGYVFAPGWRPGGRCFWMPWAGVGV